MPEGSFSRVLSRGEGLAGEGGGVAPPDEGKECCLFLHDFLRTKAYAAANLPYLTSLTSRSTPAPLSGRRLKTRR